MSLCSDSGKLDEEEVASLSTFGFQEARFSFIQHIERTLFKSCSPETKAQTKKSVCLCMLTSEDEWDKTYASTKHHFEDEEDVCMEMRELGYLAS